ncbi:prolipoprotein diacylglyceryl transferase [Candidatus Peregrinibacteria bacterium]|nr:MAG: prolipoprotein diacylglyceryl transferase [Candidatus Peregrinibacteria bacterium]
MYETLFHIGFFELKTFNLFLFIAISCSAWLLTALIRIQGLSVDFLMKRGLHLLLGAVVLGKVLFVIEHFSFISSSFIPLLISLSFSRFGFLFGFFLGLYFWSQREKESFFPWFESFVMSGLVFLFFMHVGHFFNGTYYGTLTDLPWGIAFDSISIPFVNPIHPTQLYSALASLSIFIYAVRGFKRTHLPGVVGGLSVALYSLASLGIDFLRAEATLLTHCYYFICFLLGLLLYYLATRRTISPTK